MTGDSATGVELYWLPLGAGGHSVRLNGWIFEAVAARLEKRPTSDLYHSALAARVPDGRFVIEMAPIPDGNGPCAASSPKGRSAAAVLGRCASSGTRTDAGATA